MGAAWKIVLVDDDDSLRRALARVIRLAGYDVAAYRTADDFARTHETLSRTCLVLDVNLPGTNGVELRRSIREAGQSAPVIFITALDREDTAQALAALDPVAVLYKPFANDELMGAIERACQE
jgi:FixJ family two-component response regulator